MTERPEDVILEEREPQPTLSVRATVPVAELTAAQGASLGELAAYAAAHSVRPAGPPFVRYHTFGEAETDLEVGVPVAQPSAGAGRVTPGELPGGPAVTTWHLGSHDRLGESYARLGAWVEQNGREPNGAGWEVYWWIDPSVAPDPSAWPPPSEWRTQLIQPLR